MGKFNGAVTLITLGNCSWHLVRLSILFRSLMLTQMLSDLMRFNDKFKIIAISFPPTPKSLWKLCGPIDECGKWKWTPFRHLSVPDEMNSRNLINLMGGRLKQLHKRVNLFQLTIWRRMKNDTDETLEIFNFAFHLSPSMHHLFRIRRTVWVRN